ncbi:hypothetical protein LBMAG56_40270 [Verrucomicrobiota bacterium]|nr:hypothetical protein LBMAG56_40270 [Verrucomicrobiota bacterium]
MNALKTNLPRRSARQRARLASLGLLLLAAVPAARAQAVIEGQVTLAAAPAAPPPGQRYQNPAGGAIPPPEPPAAIVYLAGKFPEPATPPRVQLPQKNFRFATEVLPVRKGTTIEFPNDDDFYHNVFSYSKPKRFDLGRYLKTEKPPGQLFDQPGVVRLYCEIHEHMRCTVLVLDTPHFTKTDVAGKFRLTQLPAGTYTLTAWLGEKIIREQKVELHDGQTLRVDFPAP